MVQQIARRCAADEGLVRKQRPASAILIVSGVEWPGEEQMPMGVRFLRKPFTPEVLAAGLQAVLVARWIGP